MTRNTQLENVTTPLPREGKGGGAAWLFLLLAVFAIGKFVFVWYNRDIASVTGGQLLGILWHGLLLDIRTSALLLLLPALCLWLMRRRRRWVLVPYFCLLGLVVGTIIVADIVMYEFWEFKLSAVHLAYAASPEGTTNSVSLWFLASRLLMVLAFVLLTAVPAICLIPKTKGKDETPPSRDATHRVRPSRLSRPWLPFLTLLAISLLPIRVGSVYHPGPLFLSHAATNPVFRFFASFGDARRYAAPLPCASASEPAGPECRPNRAAGSAPIGSAYRPNRAADLAPIGTVCRDIIATVSPLTDTLLCTRRPNVLFIMMESFGGQFVKELGGLPDVSPHLSRLIPESVFFDQYYSNSFRTDRGTVCAFSGWTSYPTVSPMKETRMHPSLSSLPKSLSRAGYQTGYLYAGAMTNMGKYQYLAAMGFEALMDESYFTREELNSSWGANDGTSAMKLYHTIARMYPRGDAETDTVPTPPHPWMMVWQTLSSHEPWDVPYHRLDDKRLNAFAYTDECVGQLVDSLRTLPVWDNLLVIIIPDHGFLYEQTYDTGDFFHSPMLWTGGAIRRPRTIHTLMNQSDIAATLLAQMQLPHGDYPWSRNVFAPDYAPSVYCTYPAGLFYKDLTGETVYDLTAERPIPVGQPADSLRLSKALDILHRSYRELNKDNPTTDYTDCTDYAPAIPQK